MEKKCIGIDVGGTTVKIGIFETDGTLVYKWEVPSRKEENGAYILPDVAASIRKKLNERGIPMDAVIGAGMGFPGPVQPDGYVEVCVNLGWRDLNPQKILSELLDGMPVRSGNDANVAALGEMWQGGGKGCHDIVMVTLGTGVGGGIIINGKIVTGSNGAGGEIGHIHIEALTNLATVATPDVWNRLHLRQVLYIWQTKSWHPAIPLPFCVTEKSVQKASLMP